MKGFNKIVQESLDTHKHEKLMTHNGKYEAAPKILYDEATGEVSIEEKVIETKTYIKSFTEYERKYSKLEEIYEVNRAKLNLDEPIEDTAEKVKDVLDMMDAEYELDLFEFDVFTRDMYEVNIGLLLSRPAIFLKHDKVGIDFAKFRHGFMNEYCLDQTKRIAQIDKESPNYENLLDSPNIKRDQLTTHYYTDEDGVEQTYFGASKNWETVSPDIDDPKNFHYASANRVYLIVKNKLSQEWEFPTSSFRFGTTMYEARINLFDSFSSPRWRVRHVGKVPILHTMRDFTEAEVKKMRHSKLNGVRSYYFEAYHLRGLPEFNFDETLWDDYRWIPTPELN